MNVRLWGVLFILLAGLGSVSWLLSRRQTAPQRAPLQMPSEQALKGVAGTDTPKLKQATKQPGRVVVLNTNRGCIEFVLYEKDCPRTTTRIASLVEGGFYDGVTFPRVENWVIQTAQAKRDIPPMGLELTKGLTHCRGTVGIARTDNPNSNTSVFYITLEATPALDAGYTNFGRVIKGMDVVEKIKPNDKIVKATIRPSTPADRNTLKALLRGDSK